MSTLNIGFGREPADSKWSCDSPFTNTGSINSLPNGKFLRRSKLKAFADNKSNVIEKLKFVLGWVENIVGKGENAGFPAFSPFPTLFSNGFLCRVVKSCDCVVKS